MGSNNWIPLCDIEVEAQRDKVLETEIAQGEVIRSSSLNLKYAAVHKAICVLSGEECPTQSSGGSFSATNNWDTTLATFSSWVEEIGSASTTITLGTDTFYEWAVLSPAISLTDADANTQNGDLTTMNQIYTVYSNFGYCYVESYSGDTYWGFSEGGDNGSGGVVTAAEISQACFDMAKDISAQMQANPNNSSNLCLAEPTGNSTSWSTEVTTGTCGTFSSLP